MQQSESQQEEQRIFVQQLKSQPEEQRICVQQSASQPEEQRIFVQQQETMTNPQEAAVSAADTGGAALVNLLDEEATTTESITTRSVLVRHSFAEARGSISQLCSIQSAVKWELLALQPEVL